MDAAILFKRHGILQTCVTDQAKKRSQRDISQLARAIIEEATGESLTEPSHLPENSQRTNPQKEPRRRGPRETWG